MIPCPQLAKHLDLVYDSQRDYKRTPPPQWQGLDHLPRPRTCDRPPVCMPQAHYMLAWDDHHRDYYLYTKCIWHDDAILLANVMISMSLATRIQVYGLRPETYRAGYIDDAVIFLFDGVQPARTVQQTWGDLLHIFKTLLVARSYIPRVYYDDVDEGLPIISTTPWRPRKPKTARGWHEMLNLVTTCFKSHLP